MTKEELVKLKCKELGITQKYLEKKLNVSQGQISAALNGKNKRSLSRIIDILQTEYGVKPQLLEPSSYISLEKITNSLTELTSIIQDLEKQIRQVVEKLDDKDK